MELKYYVFRQFDNDDDFEVAIIARDELSARQLLASRYISYAAFELVFVKPAEGLVLRI